MMKPILKTIIKRVHPGVQNGESGVYHLKCPILTPVDSKNLEKFIRHDRELYTNPFMDTLKILPCPSVQSSLF